MSEYWWTVNWKLCSIPDFLNLRMSQGRPGCSTLWCSWPHCFLCSTSEIICLGVCMLWDAFLQPESPSGCVSQGDWHPSSQLSDLISAVSFFSCLSQRPLLTLPQLYANAKGHLVLLEAVCRAGRPPWLHSSAESAKGQRSQITFWSFTT